MKVKGRVGFTGDKKVFQKSHQIVFCVELNLWVVNFSQSLISHQCLTYSELWQLTHKVFLFYLTNRHSSTYFMTKTPKIPCPFSFFDQENLFMNNLIGISSKCFHREAKNPESRILKSQSRSQIPNFHTGSGFGRDFELECRPLHIDNL